MKKIKLDNIINGLLYLYIFSLYFFTFVEGFNIISNAILFMFILLFWFNHLTNNKNVVFNKFLGLSAIFLVFVLVSLFVALDMDIAFGKFITLILIFIMMFTMVNYFDNKDKIYNLIKAFAISGLLSTVYLFTVSDFTEIMRFGDQLGNVNEIAIILTISATFSLVIFNKENNKLFLLFWFLITIMIFLTGSRTGFMFILITSIIAFYGRFDINLKTIIPMFLIIAAIMFLFYYSVMNIEMFYNILGKRIETMTDGFLGTGSSDRSFDIRMEMISSGWQWFKEKPLFGHGIDNYRVLHPLNTYSHNNVIELLFGIGLFGTIVFYLNYVIVLIKLYKVKDYNRILLLPLCGILIGYLIMSFGLVFYDSKHIAIIMSISSVIPTILHNGVVKQGKEGEI